MDGALTILYTHYVTWNANAITEVRYYYDSATENRIVPRSGWTLSRCPLTSFRLPECPIKATLKPQHDSTICSPPNQRFRLVQNGANAVHKLHRK